MQFADRKRKEKTKMPGNLNGEHSVDGFWIFISRNSRRSSSSLAVTHRQRVPNQPFASTSLFTFIGTQTEALRMAIRQRRTRTKAH